MQRRIIIFLLVLTMFIVSCGAPKMASSPTQAPSAPMESPASNAREEKADSNWDGDAASTADDEAGVEVGETVPRMIIYNAGLGLVVKDTVATQEAITEMVAEMGGYISNSSSYAYGNGLERRTLTVRVPAENFNAAMALLREMALEISNESIASQDVTQEYVDLESRLRALEAKATRLEELMEQAEDTEAVLAVYEQLSATQQEIEQTKGRMRYLERSAAMATITVQLTPDELSQPVEIAGWRPGGTLKRAIESLINAFQFLIDALIWIIIFILPVLLFIGLVIFAFIRLLGMIFGRRRRKLQQSKPPKSSDLDASQ